MTTLTIDVLLKELKYDLIKTSLKFEDKLKIDGSLIIIKNSDGKHTFIQQNNGEWTIITKYKRKSETDKPVNLKHGETLYSYCGDTRKKLFIKLIKRVLNDNKIEYVEMGR